MKPSLQIIETGDGSHTIYNTTLDETYHSRHGAVQESKHVFVQEGLGFYVSQHSDKQKVSILEVGLGTGLNALLTADFCDQQNVEISYLGLEPFPVDEQLINSLNYSKDAEISRSILQKIHKGPWEEPISITDNFSITKSEIRIQDLNTETRFDVCFFDAFAPSKQPEMWQKANLERVYDHLLPDGIIVTYCAKGQFKRDLKEVGFSVQSIPGPPGKREMIRGVKP